MSENQTTQVFCYITNELKLVEHKKSDTCEDVCLRMCMQLKFTPLVQLLFGLRERNKEKVWVPPCRHLDPAVEYEFRLRFKVGECC